MEYKVMAGEGYKLRLHGHYRTLLGARRAATIASCGGDRTARVYRDSGMVDDLGLTRWDEVRRGEC